MYHSRKIGSVTYASGGRQTLELDREGILMGLRLRLQFTVTNGGSAAVGPLFQTLARLLSRIEVIAGGRDTVWSITGPDLATRIFLESGVHAQGMSDTVVLTGSAATAYDIVLPIHFTLPRGRRPDDTGLDTRGLSSLTLAITWAASDCTDFYTTPNSAAISAVTCSVEGRYLLNVGAKDAFMVRAIDTVERELTGSSDNFDLVMDRGTGLLYRSFLVTTLANKLGVNTILNPGQLRLQAGSFVYHNVDGPQLRGENKEQLGITTLIDGVYFMPLTFLGQLTTGVDTTNLGSDLKLIFNATKVTGTNIIRVSREAVRPLRLA